MSNDPRVLNSSSVFRSRTSADLVSVPFYSLTFVELTTLMRLIGSRMGWNISHTFCKKSRSSLAAQRKVRMRRYTGRTGMIPWFNGAQEINCSRNGGSIFGISLYGYSSRGVSMNQLLGTEIYLEERLEYWNDLLSNVLGALDLIDCLYITEFPSFEFHFLPGKREENLIIVKYSGSSWHYVVSTRFKISPPPP